MNLYVPFGTAPVATGVVIGVAGVVPEASRLINVSSRLQVADGNAEHTVIMGFAIRGTGQQRLLVRGVGPGLVEFGVETPLPNPRLRLFDAAGNILRENDDWSGTEVSATASAMGRAICPS